MKNLLKFLSVPVAALGLVILLGIAGGIENGTVSLSVGVVAAGVMLVIEGLALRAALSRERDADREEEAEDG